MATVTITLCDRDEPDAANKVSVTVNSSPGIELGHPAEPLTPAQVLALVMVESSLQTRQLVCAKGETMSGELTEAFSQTFSKPSE